MTHFFELFGLPLLACGAMASILPCFGMHVLRREVIFIDIALAQFAALGAVASHVAFHVHGDSLWGYAAALSAALLAAAFYALVRSKVEEIGLETVIGVTFAIAAAGALFVAGVAPGGHVHVQHMLAGSLLLTTASQVLRATAGFAAAGLVLFVLRRPLKRISENYALAAQTGLRVVWWDFVFYALIGVVITLAVSIGGVVLVFALLIIPATMSAVFSDRWGVRLVIAWVTGAAASVAGVVFANQLDFSVGPAISMFLGAGLAILGLWRIFARLRARGSPS